MQEEIDIYNEGERALELIIMPYPKVNVLKVEELEKSVRGSKGFGSSGND
tara:strand:+ start:9950 stop:10099 length:150 start_codon:yes stop_codon:yes gene_type:complete